MTPSKVFTGLDLSCDNDVSSDDAKTIVEQVGGLVTDDYTVKFLQSTQLGVVALVDGDTARAFQELRDNYGVVVVTGLDEDRGPGTVSGFSQIAEIVADRCD
jgi:CTP:phosphocholine cytidylyltransferase-like protein